MVVVAIVGILMAVGVIAFTGARINARDATRRGDIGAITKTLEQYFQNNSTYPSDENDIATYFPSDQLPVDPQGPDYNYSLTTSGYCVCATLERVGRGNATALGSGGVCTYGTGVGADYFCASNLQ
jgi:type II secretory pathway pseudopilin PulG